MASWDLPIDPLDALRIGDPRPFEAFVRSHARAFFAFFRRQGASLHRSEDLTQEVFLKLYNHAPRYRPEERFQALCFRIARNVWIDDRRRRAVRGGDRTAEREVREQDAEAPEGDPIERVAVVEESARLSAALTQLPETHRAVFELAVIEEMGYADIAATLDIPVGTVKSRMYHAVRKLRRAVEADGKGQRAGSEEGAA